MLNTSSRTFDPNRAFELEMDGLSPLVARILAARGLTAKAEAAGALSELLPYSALLNCEQMAERLADLIELDARLLIVADYDCDGATACSVGLRALKGMGADIRYMVPDRMIHGYGLTPSIVQEAAQLDPKPDYIITVDNGIASHAGIEEASKLGIRVLVTDHHLAAETLPDADCIVNPNQPADTFDSKALAGVGVMYYVSWALRDELKRRGHPGGDFDVLTLLPLFAIGTVADVVRLDRNNRILVAQGLTLIRKGHGPVGVKALCTVAKKDIKKLCTMVIGFGLGPRINAAGRLSTMHAGIECLCTDDPVRAAELATLLDETNASRKDVESDVVAGALEQLISGVSSDAYTVALHAEGWHEGVIGIAAGRIKERLHRPTFIFTTNAHGELKGSGRSIPGFHLRDAMDVVSKRDPDIFLKFGGHAMAAGATVRADKFDAFKTLFEQVCREMIDPSVLDHIIETDGELLVQEMNLGAVKALSEYVWGQGFPEPTFEGEFDVFAFKRMGDEGKHLRLTLLKDNMRFTAVRFNHEGPIPSKVRAIYKLNANTFRGETTLQLMVDQLEVLEELKAAA